MTTTASKLAPPRKPRPLRRLHNYSFITFSIAVLFIIIVPLPKQMTLSKLTLRHVKVTPSMFFSPSQRRTASTTRTSSVTSSSATSASSTTSTITESSATTTLTNASRSDIIDQLNANRELVENSRHDPRSQAKIIEPAIQGLSNPSLVTTGTTSSTTTTANETNISTSTISSSAHSNNGSVTETNLGPSIDSTSPSHALRTGSLSQTEVEIEQLLANSSHLQSNPRTNSTYILFRAVGNDLPPRHALGQSYSNIKFILDHEQSLPDLDVRWYVNRIYDDAERLRILQLLVERKQYFVVNDFNLTEYAKVDFRLKDYFGYRDVLRSKVTMKGLSLTDFKYARAWDMIFEAKNHYIVHNNQARNAMISLGRDAGATYILPWDGNCFLNAKAWTNITSSISTIVNNASIINNSTAANSSTTTAHLLLSSSSTKYFYVPMARMKNDGGNALLKTSDYVPNSMPDEPQLIFHRSANATFDETKPYGYRPKVDLLWRLRIPEFQFRDRQGRVLNKTMAWKHVPDIPGYDSVRPVGWTARLFSGARSLEGADANTAIARGWSRSDGLEQLAARASLRYAERHLNYSRHSSTLLYNRRLLPLRASRMNNSFARVLAFAQTDPPPPLQSSSLSSSEFNPMNVSALAKHAMAVSIVQRVEQGSSTNYYKATVDGVLQWFTTVQPQSVLLSGDVCTLIHTCALVDSSRLLVDKQDATNSVLDVAQRQRQQHVVSKWARDMSDLMTAAIQNVDNDPDTTRTAVRQKWMPVYFSQTRDAVLFETAAACIAAAAAVTSSSGSAGGGSNKVMMDRFHMSLRHTSLARLRLHDMYPLDGNADTNQTTYNKREGLRGLMPWFLLASVGERFGVDIWRYLPPAERKRAPSSIENQRLPLLIHGIRKTLLDAEQRDDAREVKLVAWVRAMVRRKFSRSEAIDAGVTDIEEIEDEQVLDKTNSEDIDRAIPPFFELGI